MCRIRNKYYEMFFLIFNNPNIENFITIWNNSNYKNILYFCTVFATYKSKECNYGGGDLLI